MTPCLAPPARPRRMAPRRAFTLVEVLVVITIIAVLASLVAVAGVRFVVSAREAATRTTIEKVDEAIADRVSAVNRWHQRPISRLQNDWRFRGWRARWDAYQLDWYTDAAARTEVDITLSRKGMLFELLPMTVGELKLAYWFWAKFDDPSVPSVVTINDVRVPYLATAEIAKMDEWLDDMDGDASNGKQGLDRPGEVFLYALHNAPVVGGTRVPEEEFKPSELVDPDQDGVPELGDAWGRGLSFYRWPTRLVNGNTPVTSSWDNNPARKTLMPNAPKSDAANPRNELDLKTDPDDRAGYTAMNHPAWGGPIVLYFHDANTWHAPLVVSAGPDGEPGIDPPETTYPAAMPGFPPRVGLAAAIAGKEEALYDDITNHSGRAGGPTQ